MRAYTRRRLLASLKLGLATIPITAVVVLVTGLKLVPGPFLFGFATGCAVGITELFLFKRWLTNLSFLAHLVVKSILFIGLMYALFAALNVLDVLLEHVSWSQYLTVLTQSNTLIAAGATYLIIVFLLFVVQLDRLLGPGVLLRYMTGRYHRPRREQRVFMFLDLKGSTHLADQMDPDRYFDFLHHYFAEMSEPILETNAEIYQYVGDEIVLTWPMKRGLTEASCVRAFFLIHDQIGRRKQFFHETYGVVPEFKAGLHAGEVITAQIGELKKEIVYNGDVLNTTARIQSLCNSMGERLLVSTELVRQLSLGSEYVVRDLGSVALRGKADKLELSAVGLTVPG